MFITIFAVDALAIHQCQVIVKQVVKQVAIYYNTNVASCMVALQRVILYTQHIASHLRIVVNDFRFGRRNTILQAEGGLKLTSLDSQLGNEFVLRPQFLHRIGTESKGKHRLPMISNLSCHSQVTSFQVERILVNVSVFIIITCLQKASYGQAFLHGIDNVVGMNVFLFLGESP